MNNGFVDIGLNPSKSITNSSKPFRNFLKNSLLNSFLVKPTSIDEGDKPIFQLSQVSQLQFWRTMITFYQICWALPFIDCLNKVFSRIFNNCSSHASSQKRRLSHYLCYRFLPLLLVFGKILEKFVYIRLTPISVNIN